MIKLDKSLDIASANNVVHINDRKSIHLTGVKKIESFDNEDFLLITNLGTLHLKGEELEIMKLDTLEGNVSIKGKICSLQYLDGQEKGKESTIFSKLFK